VQFQLYIALTTRRSRLSRQLFIIYDMRSWSATLVSSEDSKLRCSSLSRQVKGMISNMEHEGYSPLNLLLRAWLSLFSRKFTGLPGRCTSGVQAFNDGLPSRCPSSVLAASLSKLVRSIYKSRRLQDGQTVAVIGRSTQDLDDLHASLLRTTIERGRIAGTIEMMTMLPSTLLLLEKGSCRLPCPAVGELF
jgi:hypothetical protein